MPGTEYMPQTGRKNGQAGEGPKFVSYPHNPQPENRPITRGDVLRVLGSIKAELAGAAIVLTAVAYLFHWAYSDGWLNKIAKDSDLTAIVTRQDSVNADIKSNIDGMKRTLDTQSVALGAITATQQRQNEALGEIKGFLSAQVQQIQSPLTFSPPSIAAVAPSQVPAEYLPPYLPAATHPKRKVKKPTPKPASGWTVLPATSKTN